MQIKDLLEKVGANIKESAPTVAERVTAALTEREVQARTEAFIAVIGKLEEARKAGAKIKPDVEQFAVGPDGAPAKESTKSFSKAKLDEFNKNRQEQEKLEGALNKALEGDFGKVKELAGKGGGKPAETE